MLVQHRNCKQSVVVGASVVCTYVCMCVWSALSVEHGSTGYGCLFCSWSAEQENISFSLSAFVPENLVSRDEVGRPVPRSPVYSPPHSG